MQKVSIKLLAGLTERIRNFFSLHKDVPSTEDSPPNKGRKLLDEEGEKKLALQRAVLPYGMFPSQFSISLGAAPCIHSCLFCPQSVEKPAEKTWLQLEVLEKSLREMPEDKIQLNVSSYSETMHAPNLFSSLELMKGIRPNLPIVLATSGVSITEEQVHRLIDLGLEMLQFSFDAADPESYKTLMQCNHFNRATEKLEMICRIRDERKSGMKVITHIMAFENQKDGFEKFKLAWENKVDIINFRPVGNWGEENLNLKKQLAEKGFIPIYKKPENRYPCTSIFMHFKLSPDGFYYPCVAYIPGDDKDRAFALGNARVMTFKEAWNQLNLLRQKHLTGNWDGCHHCESCDVWGLWEDMFYEENGKFDLDNSIKAMDSWS
jgi:radical SAM protein with 4Fe4S-binding SPASM domain